MTSTVPRSEQHPPASSPRASALAARDRRVLWHPFTQHSQWAREDPIVVERAEGCHVVDVDGRRYLDAMASLWVNVHGHSEPALRRAALDQLDKAAHTTFMGLTHEPGIELAEQILAVAPAGLTRVFYGSDGSSSVDAAIKMSYQAARQRGEERPRYVVLEEGYHGDTVGAVGLTGMEWLHSTFAPLLLPTDRISSPGVLRPGQDRAERAGEVVDELGALLQRSGEQTCAVVVEPIVQAAGGVRVHHPDFLTGVRALCDEFGVAMIADEVAVGVGATGRWFAVDHAGVRPDLLTLGKRITGGTLPMSAVLTTESVFEAFLGEPDSGREFAHGHTYAGNPLTCAVALANLRLMHERGTVERAAHVGETVLPALTTLVEHDVVVDVRGIGAIAGIEMRDAGSAVAVCREARRRGVLVLDVGETVAIIPPLSIDATDLSEVVDVVTSSVDAVQRSSE